MITKQTKISKEELQKVAHIEESVRHWSNEHTNISMKGRKILETIETLYQARSEILEKAYGEAGIDPASIQNVQIDGEGTVTVMCADPTPGPENNV